MSYRNTLGAAALCAALIFMFAPQGAQGQGFFRKLLGQDDDQAAQQQQAIDQAQQQQMQDQQAVDAQKSDIRGKGIKGKSGATFKPLDPNATPKPTPTKEEIKAGAAKLQKQLNWEPLPRDIFSRYVGKWKGYFYVFSPQGKKQGAQSVQLEFTLQQDGTMKMSSLSYDLVSKSYVVGEEAVYSREGDTVYVDVKQPNGTTTRQIGHFNDDHLFLQADIKDGVEAMRERIDGKRFLMDGFGVYDGGKNGREARHFIGRFLREG